MANKNAPIPIVTLTMDDDNKMDIVINKEIGSIMNEDDRSDSVAGQRVYASEALTFALAANAKELVNEGVHVDEVMARILESLADNLHWALDIDIRVGTVGPKTDNGNNGNLPC